MLHNGTIIVSKLLVSLVLISLCSSTRSGIFAHLAIKQVYGWVVATENPCGDQSPRSGSSSPIANHPQCGLKSQPHLMGMKVIVPSWDFQSSTPELKTEQTRPRTDLACAASAANAAVDPDPPSPDHGDAAFTSAKPTTTPPST